MRQLPQGIAQTPVVTQVFKDQFSMTKKTLCACFWREDQFSKAENLSVPEVFMCGAKHSKPQSHM